MRVKTGTIGKVIDVQVFTRDGIEKDERAKQIEEGQNSRVSARISTMIPYRRSCDFRSPREAVLEGQKADGGAGLKKGDTRSADYLAEPL